MIEQSCCNKENIKLISVKFHFRNTSDFFLWSSRISHSRRQTRDSTSSSWSTLHKEMHKLLFQC